MAYVNGKYYSSAKEGLAAAKKGGASSSSSSPKPSGTSSSASSAARPTSGGTSSGGGTSAQKLYSDGYGGYTAVNPSTGRTSGSSVQYGGTPSGGVSTDYHQEAINAAAAGDWAKVAKALQARQAKINAQGGNDRGTSNAAILASLQKQYADSYNRLSQANRQVVSGMATGNIGGIPTNPAGWTPGKDYLASAMEYARQGDMTAAQDELMRRGFKLYDTGSAGGGTSQDQAYALIRQLYNQSPAALQSWQDQTARNADLLAAHPTQFGAGTNPALANKHFTSADGKYVIYYDASGTPVAAKPSGDGSGYARQYSPDEIELMRQYYSGADGTDFAELQRQMHNNSVVYTGNGRLIDQYGSFASGTPVGLTDAYGWTGQIPGTEYNRGQDAAALRAILARINAGESFGTLGGGTGSSVSVPVTRPVTEPSAAVTRPSGGYSGYGSGTPSGELAELGDGGLADLLRQMYANSLDAQLAGLRSTYEQNAADIRAQDDLISRLYADQKNQAAVQNDLQRMQMAEFGALRGLNTGASGQLALAQSAAYQGTLGGLGSAEAQSLADNALNLQKLTAGYRASLDQAEAQNNAQLAEALYSEYVRQINAAQQAQAAALAQSNWERQFAYSQQQDALSQANWERQFNYGQQQDEQDRASALQKLLYDQQAAAASSAADWAELLLKNGAMPDGELLAAAGLSSGSAQAMTDAYWRALNLKNAPRSSSSGRSFGGSSSASSGKPKLTYAQAKAAAEDGLATQEVIDAINYYGGAGAYEQLYGNANANTTPRETPVQSGQAMNPDYYRAFGQSVQAQLNSGKTDAAIRNVESQWAKLSAQQQDGIQNILKKYGYSYKP